MFAGSLNLASSGDRRVLRADYFFLALKKKLPRELENLLSISAMYRRPSFIVIADERLLLAVRGLSLQVEDGQELPSDACRTSETIYI
jgi:hypothetical protein